MSDEMNNDEPAPTVVSIGEATAAPQSRAREELSCRMCGTPVTYRMLRRPLWLWWLLFRKRSS